MGRFLGGRQKYLTQKKFFYVGTKSKPNIRNVLQIVVEIDRGVGHSHSNRTTSKSAPHVIHNIYTTVLISYSHKNEKYLRKGWQ